MANRNHTPAFIATLDEREVAVRIAETVLNMTRPRDKSLDECVASLHDNHRVLFMKAARVAVEYLKEQIAKSESVS